MNNERTIKIYQKLKSDQCWSFNAFWWTWHNSKKYQDFSGLWLVLLYERTNKVCLDHWEYQGDFSSCCWCACSIWSCFYSEVQCKTAESEETSGIQGGLKWIQVAPKSPRRARAQIKAHRASKDRFYWELRGEIQRWLCRGGFEASFCARAHWALYTALLPQAPPLIWEEYCLLPACAEQALKSDSGDRNCSCRKVRFQQQLSTGLRGLVKGAPQ